MAWYRKTTPSVYPTLPVSNFTDSSKNWRQYKNLYRKTSGNETASLTQVAGRYTDDTRTWRRIKALYRFTSSGTWQKVFGKFAGQPYPEVNPVLRYNSYNGTDIGTYAYMGLDNPDDSDKSNYIQQGAANNVITFIWGKDGQDWQNIENATRSGTTLTRSLSPIAGGSLPIENDEGFYDGDKLRNTQAVIEQHDGYYIWYRDKYTTTGGSTGTAYSQMVKLIKQAPTGTITSSTNSAQAGVSKSINYTIDNTWYKSANLSNSSISWYIKENQYTEPVPSELARTNSIATLSPTGTGTLSGQDSFIIPSTFNGVSTNGKWLYVELRLRNSGTQTGGGPYFPNNDFVDYVEPVEIGVIPLQLVSGSYPTISGTVKEGETVTAVTGNWEGNAPITFEYQWLEPVLVIDEFYYFDIPGATSSSYFIPYNYTEDIAPNIALRVTAKNPGNTTGVQALSNIYSVTDAPRPVGTAGTVTFSRDSQSSYNYSITSVGTWTNTPTSYRYQWYSRDGIAYPKITGATSSTFDAVNYVTSDIFPIVWASNSAGESNTGYPSGPYQSAETLGAIRSSENTRVYYKAPIINSFSATGSAGNASYNFNVSRFDTSMSLLISYSGQSSGSFSPYNSGDTQVQVYGDYPLAAGTYTLVLKATNTGTNGGDYFVTSTVTNVVVTAPIPQYTITFNANGGSVAEPTITVYQGESVVAQTPTRPGYTFSHWRNPPSGDLVYIYNAGAVFTPTESFTLTAIWILNVAPSGGSVTITGTQKINNTLTANVTNASGYPTPTYTYKWRRGVLIGGVLYFSDISGATSSTYALVSADVGYYIRVEVTFTNGIGSDQMAPATTGAIANLAQYTITFNPNGGNAVAEPIVTVTEGESVYAPLPTRSGYTFSRWRNPPSGDLMYTYYAGDTFTPTESFTLTAIWTLNVTPVVPNVTPVIPVVPNVTPVVPVVPVTPNVTTWYGSACCTSQFSDFGIQATRSSQAEVFNALDAACLGYMYNVQYSSVTYPADPCGVTPVVPVVPNVTPVVPVVPNVTPVVPVVPVVPNVTPVVPDLTPIVPVLPSCIGCFYGPIDNFGFQSICCYDVPACTYSCFSL